MKNRTAIFSFCLAVFVVIIALLGAPASAAPAAQFTTFPTPTPGPDGRITYIAQERDSAWRIAAIFNIPLDKLYELNKWGNDHVIQPGDEVFLGMAGPLGVTPTAGPSPTPQPVTPTVTPEPGWGVLCVLLYDDLNGDSMRQEDEPVLPGGAISVSNRSGSISMTANSEEGGTDRDCNNNPLTGYDPAMGFVGLNKLPEGQYNVSVAAPDGYNPTTVMNSSLKLDAGAVTYVAFGAQANAETVAELPVIPATPRRSPVLGILGVLILVSGVGLGVYAALLRKTK